MKFLRFENVYMLMNRHAQAVERLPVGTYLVKFNKEKLIYELETATNFKEPSRIYGNLNHISDRILKTFQDREASTGVALSGEKGSGKSLVAKSVAIKAFNLDIPTLIVSEPHHGEEFNQFIQDIEQPVVVLFDEFEKVYDREAQEALLTLFDGMFPTRKLFVLTANDQYAIDTHMSNRPGRIYYSIDFHGVDQSVIDEYTKSNLKNQANAEGISRIASLFESFNFDMLKALVEEMNRYNETAMQAVKYLNTRPEAGDEEYKGSLSIKNKLVELTHDEVYINPLKTASFDVTYLKGKGDDKERVKASFGLDNLRGINGETGEYVYQRDDMVLTVVKQRVRRFDWAKQHLLA